MVTSVEADPEGAKERTLHVFAVENQALNHTRSRGVYSDYSRCKDLFHARRVRKNHPFFEEESDMERPAGDDALQPQQKDSVSAFGIDRPDDCFSTTAERKGSLL